jgi:lipopolysaccharide transport system ATP-binding protein
VAFAEVEQFLDTPVKRYSSGMYVRLAFAVAAHLEPEILLVDEVLAVGDAQFQKKCLGKMEDVSKQGGRTILFVSHNLAAIQQLCTKAIILSKGQVSFVGPANEGVERYITNTERSLEQGEDGYVDLDLARGKIHKTKLFKRIRTLDKNNNPCKTFPMLSSMRIEVELNNAERFPNADYGVYIDTYAGLRVTTFLPSWVQANADRLISKSIVIEIPSLKFNAGSYRVGLSAAFVNAGEFIDHVENATSFNVESIDIFGSGRLFPQYCGVVIPEGESTVQ